MRVKFPGYFRPSSEEFDSIWAECYFAFDANVLLNAYRYSPTARTGLLNALRSIQDRAFVPHQSAKEFLRNRLSVTAGQVDEYVKAIKQITDLIENLSNNKRHPFLPDDELPSFREQAQHWCEQLEMQKKAVATRLSSDDLLDVLNDLFEDRTGSPLTAGEMKGLENEGVVRYKNDIPPGYKDGKKNSDGDVYRKYGDLIIWKQLIQQSKRENKHCIFVTDDRKDDWWLEQSGRTVGPRPELVEEFLSETGKKFWMYSVERFLQEAAARAKVEISPQVIQEVVELREDARELAAVSDIQSEVEAATETRIRRSARRPHPAFTEGLFPSEALAAIVGNEALPRTALVAKLWSYIKDHDLQDKVNRRIIHADERLLPIFGKAEVSMFELAGLIGRHVQRP